MIERPIVVAVEDALRQPGTVLLTGLPRIGRTTLAASIVRNAVGGRLVDADALRATDDWRSFCMTNAGTVVAVDGIEERSEPVVAALVRAASEVQTRPCLLLLPSDSATAFRLQRRLIGHLKLIEVTSIQPDEGAADSLTRHEASGPLADVKPIETVSNRRPWSQYEHWLRGGLPQSLLADSDTTSFDWRRSYLEGLQRCDLRPWGVDAGDRPSEILQWLANGHGQRFDVSKCASALSVPKSRVRVVISAFEELGLVRQLQNWPAGANNSIGGLPVPYLRDSGLLHALIRVQDLRELQAHDLYGHSWEGFALEALISAAGNGATAACYRDENDHEIDLILSFSAGGPVYAIEFKTSSDKNVEAGFWHACRRIGATDRLIVHSGSTEVRHGDQLEGIPLLSAISRVRALTAMRTVART